MFTPLARHSFTKLQDRRGRVDSGTSGPAETSPAWRKERLDESTQVKRKGSNKGMISCVSSPMLGLKIYIFLLFKMLSLSYIKKIKANRHLPQYCSLPRSIVTWVLMLMSPLLLDFELLSCLNSPAQDLANRYFPHKSMNKWRRTTKAFHNNNSCSEKGIGLCRSFWTSLHGRHAWHDI